MFLTTAFPTMPKWTETGSSRPTLSTDHCNRERFGENLHFQSCFEAVMTIRQDQAPITLAMRNSGKRSDIPLPHRIVSCKSLRLISLLLLLLLIQEISADGLCAIDIVLGRGTVTDILGATYMVYRICAKENQDHIEGMVFSVGRYLRNRQKDETTMQKHRVVEND